jgi:two-component system sensor histidine kinase TctE
MIKQIWFTNLGQEALMLILVIPLVWVALRQGMRSTLRLRDTVQGRAAGTLEALDPAPVPAEIRPLVIAINDYVRDLEAQVAARSRFIANASHQLRTPLTVLQTQVSFGLKTADPAQKEEVMKAILSGIQVATRLVNQLLSLSAAESSGRQHGRAEVDLGGLAKHVLEEYASLAQAKEIDLGLERKRAEPILVNASPLMLHEMVSNLVDNALRYTPAGGVVTVAVEWNDGFPVLRIEDNGPGIPPAERERVFERFYRLQEMDSLGCGLGLAIVREVASAMDATVILAAPPSGTGLVVTVGFPPAGPACREDARS